MGGRASWPGEEEEVGGSLGEGSWLAWCWSVHGICACVAFCSSVEGCSGSAWKLYCDLKVCGFCVAVVHSRTSVVVTVENFLWCDCAKWFVVYCMYIYCDIVLRFYLGVDCFHALLRFAFIVLTRRRYGCYRG
jgi:hypothetical protein